ncbi:GNAT family N-acetyltransferase, partial [candidate division GN15 bacterium]|nr:GNAT family N-acetyltransferase [candidate division GN15 bacterium]
MHPDVCPAGDRYPCCSSLPCEALQTTVDGGYVGEVKRIDEKSLDDAVAIVCRAYPRFGGLAESDRERVRRTMQQELSDPRVSQWGLFRDNELVGAMRFHDFRLNVRGTAVTAGGVGGVAVDLMHKKERVAWE